jgi:hypothetical protein
MKLGFYVQLFFSLAHFRLDTYIMFFRCRYFLRIKIFFWVDSYKSPIDGSHQNMEVCPQYSYGKQNIILISHEICTVELTLTKIRQSMYRISRDSRAFVFNAFIQNCA